MKAAANKLERVSAYRQLQGLSNMTTQLHGRNLDEYDVPGCNLDPVGEDEKRIAAQRGELKAAFIVNRVTRTMRPVLPDGLQAVLLAVFMLDQGAIGCAASGFVDHIGKMIVIRYEKAHRLIRDIKGPLAKCCKGAVLKAQVFSSYIWNLASKPWGSGWFGTLLQRALSIWQLQTTRHSAVFQKYLPRIAEELGGMAFTTEEEQESKILMYKV